MTITNQLMNAPVGSTIHFNGKTVMVIGNISLDSQESADGGSSWSSRNASAYRIIALEDGKVLACFPKKDGGAMAWFHMNLADAANISGFIQPHAKDFGAKGQGKTGKTFFIWDEGGPVEEKFQMLDIGTQKWDAEGEGFLRGKGGCRHVLAVSTSNPGKYFMVIDTREGDGEDVLMFGSLFDPEDEVESIST